MVATTLARRAAWIGVALLAAGLVGFLALGGGRPDLALQRFESEGFLAATDLSSVRHVVVEAAGRRSAYDRSPDGRSTPGTPSQGVAAGPAHRPG